MTALDRKRKAADMDHRLLIKKLVLAELDLLGRCESIDENLNEDQKTAQFSPAEIKELLAIKDDAYSDWLIRGADKDWAADWDAHAAKFRSR
jgi:hypothetical protein